MQVGVVVAESLPEHVFARLFGVLLLVTAAQVVVRARRATRAAGGHGMTEPLAVAQVRLRRASSAPARPACRAGPQVRRSPARSPAGSSFAIRISVPGPPDVTTAIVTSTGSRRRQAFAYPADGSVVAAQTTTAAVATAVARYASAKAEADATGVSLFGGEITADGVTARASAGTGVSGAGGNQAGSATANLVALGQAVTGTKIALADWGTLTVGNATADLTADTGTKAYGGSIVELDVKLTAAHGGLPAGSEIAIGVVQAAVQTAPKATAETTTTTPTTTETPQNPVSGDRPSDRKGKKAKPLIPLRAHPALTGGTYVFPVFGSSSYVDTFAASDHPDVKFHHGDDIFGTLGQPVVAVTDGTIFLVGWEKVGGNRMWLLDSQGNQFYYAHLSAYTTAAHNGAHVRAGEVIGFMGNTGDAEPTPVHLHFEIHPVKFLYLGYDGAVDPTRYLDEWHHQQDLPYPIAPAWAPDVPGAHAGPEPGAILLGVSDISSADGLDPASIRRALEPRPRSAPREGRRPRSPLRWATRRDLRAET